MSDRIAEMLTQIRNASMIGRLFVDLRLSKLNKNICSTLIAEGFAWDLEISDNWVNKIRLYLKYDSAGRSVISHIARISKSGRRVYAGAEAVPRIAHGFGVVIVSTPKGILSQRAAKEVGVGGELMVEVW